MATPPKLTEAQRTAALAKAVEARAARARIKQQLKSGEMTFREALNSNDDDVAKMKVLTVLESLPGIGKVRARELMEKVGIAHSRRMQGLGPNQRAALKRRFR